jgi:hypothetical protein
MDLQALAADASLILLVGGLSMLGLIMVLAALQSLWPDRAPPAGAEPEPHRARRLRPWRDEPALFAERTRKARPGPFRREEPTLPADRALATLVERQLGEPRLLAATPGSSRVRLYRCRGCDAQRGGTGCGFEGQSLQEAYRQHVAATATVQEVSCRIAGAEHCEFEVRT